MQTATEISLVNSAAANQKQSTSIQSLCLNALISERTFLYTKLCGVGISLVTQLQPDLDLVGVQELQIERLLLNLILSAKYSMPFGGQLLLSTSNIQFPEQKYVRLLLSIRRNPPDGSVPCVSHRRWDVKLSRKAMSAIVASSGGTMAVCQETELRSFTEVLLLSAAESAASGAGRREP